LHYFYHIAFDAKAETFNLIVTKDRAVIEGYVVGKHIGEFAGVPATNKDVRFPICVSYELENGVIRRARVYLLSEVLFAQIGTPPAKE
jgi:predicted ester cyclase